MYPTTFHPEERVISPPTGQHEEMSGLRAVIGTVEGTDTCVMTSYWKPTPEDLERLRAGGGIYLTVMCDRHPPVLMTTCANEVGL